MTLADIAPADRDWLQSRAVEMLCTLHCITDPDIRENYCLLMLGGAYTKGEIAATEQVNKLVNDTWPPKPQVVGA